MLIHWLKLKCTENFPFDAKELFYFGKINVKSSALFRFRVERDRKSGVDICLIYYFKECFLVSKGNWETFLEFTG